MEIFTSKGQVLNQMILKVPSCPKLAWFYWVGGLLSMYWGGRFRIPWKWLFLSPILSNLIGADYFFFFFHLCLLPGRGSDPNWSLDLNHCYDNARSWTNWARPWIKPTFQCSQEATNLNAPVAPKGELQCCWILNDCWPWLDIGRGRWVLFVKESLGR